MAPMYYRNAAAAIVCFDITDEASFTMMKDWVEELHQNVSQKNFVLAIACNKCDLEENRVVSRMRVEEFCSEIGAILQETSAKDNMGVNEIFHTVSERVVSLRGEELRGGGGTGGTGGGFGFCDFFLLD